MAVKTTVTAFRDDGSEATYVAMSREHFSLAVTLTVSQCMMAHMDNPMPVFAACVVGCIKVMENRCGEVPEKYSEFVKSALNLLPSKE